jgi:signal transduction histidine kinase
MTEEVMAHLFEPFFTTKEPRKGTGWGLTTAHGFVRHIGGYITADSAPGRGSTVRIYLPRVIEPESILQHHLSGEAHPVS